MNYWLWLASIDKLGSIRKKALLEHFKTPENIYNASYKELLQIDGIGEKISNNIINNKVNINLIKKIEDYMEHNSIKYVNIFDEDYPEKLREIYDPPITLFYKGDINIVKNKNIAVIGSRNPTYYGLNTAYTVAKEIAQKGYNVVSGMARGIDTEAHRGSLILENRSIAVVGCGLDYIYPKENYKIFQEISKKGLIISEFIVGTKPIPMNFPARNRIVSGISDAVIVVEAGEKSGTLITVDFALEQGKSVYAVPR